MSPRSAFCRCLPFTWSQIAPRAGWPIFAAGTSALQVAARHVQADGVAIDVVVGSLGVDAAPALAERHHELGFVVIVGGLRRVVHVTATRHQRMRALDEEEGLLAAVAAHFFLMLG